ncbi:MAG: Stp1/IreP family PP2C-type Ser/Thr phosphatase [Gammaproteobacteria bacterium]|nr:Stp1/IreP family PP2C-type Ser/Thr phosphatase [Gammaproteobacteria bacterium]MCP5202378.1 Stp1/IreP family PP2C-type Ser/Thr phosphatase [Gammaproteobacteria bacterium]
MAKPIIEVANLSDTGLKRPHNEDSTVTDSELGLAVVADGMGGYKAGEVASAIAAQLILDEVANALAKGGGDNGAGRNGLGPGGQALREAIIHANAEVYRTAQEVPQCQGMGTTVVVVLYHAGKVSIAHVGDSRVYRLQGNEFQQVTRDHSLIQELIDRGFFTPEEAAANTPKNLVTRALGIELTVEVDVQEQEAQPGEIFLLCSDGLNDMVDDEEIHLTLSKYSANLVEAASQLVRLANEKGGKDNISVVLVRPLEGRTETPGLMAKINRFLKRSS